MRNKHNNRILGRRPHHRKALMKGLVSSLLEHGSIVTTEAKAKELRLHIEPLVTDAKGDMPLAKRRRLLSKLVKASDLNLLVDVAKANETRPGGYVRLTRLPITRHDSAQTMRIEFVEKTKAS